MSIKTSIFLFLLMMGFSFSAYSGVKISSGVNAGEVYESTAAYIEVMTNKCLSFSSYGQPSYKYFTSGTANSTKFSFHGSTYSDSSCTNVYSSRYLMTKSYSKAQCELPAQYNENGLCVEPPVCEPPSELDPDTLECVTRPFCQRDSTNEQLFSSEQSCAAEGGIFSHQCSDFLESLETRCTQSDKCAIGFPGWPDCMQDLDPTDDITPPSGGFNPGSGPTANPDGPTFDKPEPDDVTPTDTTDEAVLEAIQNANRDSNEGFKALSTDLNNGFTSINNSLSKLNATNTAIGESVVDQMNQDYEIYQANKDLALQQTGAITAGASSVTDALGAQTGALTGALGEQTGALTDAIGELASKLPEQCVPDATNNWCENPHGLDASYVGDVFTQMDVVTNETIHNNNGLIEGFVRDVIDSSLTTENESIMNNSTHVLLNALGFNESCSPLTFEANGKNYSIGCEVSEKIKLVLSFLIGMYTLMTLTDILLDGITPLGRKPSPTRYA
ncbi:hypothetical protein AB4278_12510 [Vibrio splendidus]